MICDVVIVNFNAGVFLRDALTSLLCSRSVAHIYIVDNASSDDSLDLIPQDHTRITLIRNTANVGFAAACNIGLARATCENILVLNPDCQVAEDAIDHLIIALRSADRVGMVGPLLVNPDGSEQAGGRRKLPTPWLVLSRAVGVTSLGRFFSLQLPDYLQHLDPLPTAPTEIEAISGACMMVRRELIADVGPLDEGYFLHAEDLDWCMRARHQGWRIFFVPAAKVLHHKGISSRTRRLKVEYYKHKGMLRFYRKMIGETPPHWVSGLLTAGVWTRFAGIAALHLFSRQVQRIRRSFSRNPGGPGPGGQI